MSYVVEVPVTEDDLIGQMNRMRAWLDHRHFEPSSFMISYGSGRNGLRVLFKAEGEAAAFAAEFGGAPFGAAASDVAAA